jgi:GT2 family glycosyltransferase
MTPRADCGWAFAMTRRTFQDIGYMDEHLINSYDDYDYFIRAALLGYPRLLADRFCLLHEGEHTLSRVWGRNEEQSPLRLSTCSNNRDYMLKKWPELNIDAVPLTYWAIHGVEIMREWKRRVASVKTDAPLSKRA